MVVFVVGVRVVEGVRSLRCWGRFSDRGIVRFFGRFFLWE